MMKAQRFGRSAALFLGALGLLTMPAIQGSAQDVSTLRAGIWSGNCVGLKDKVLDLESVVRPNGTDIRALPGESVSNVAIDLKVLNGSAQAIAISRSGNVSGLVACAEIAGVPGADGAIAVGLREMNGSSYGGVALLTPASDGSTSVRIYLSAGLTSGTVLVKGAGDDVAIDDVISVTIDDQEIVADHTDLTAGSRVQVNVHNDGAKRHEVMLEEEGADEVPLADAYSQAETEDIAPDDDASFVVVVDRPGSYQLADHIGNSRLTLPITVT